MIGNVILRRLDLIGSLSDKDRMAVRDVSGEVRDLQAGEDILKLGERPSSSVIVLGGLLQRYKITPQGNRQIYSFYMPTDTPCLESLPMEVMDNTLGAVSPSQVGLVSHLELLRLFNAHPKVLMLAWRETLVQGAITREWLMRNSQMLAHAQVGHFFCEIMIRAKAAKLTRGDVCDLPITRDHLADALGMTIVHVNRTLMILRTAGLVNFQDGLLTVPSLEKLAEVADFDPSYLHLCH